MWTPLKKTERAADPRSALRLALQLGKTVGQLETEMSSRELSEWMAFLRIHPLPDPHWSAALICSVVCNAWGATTSPDDFLPRVGTDDEPEQTPEEALAAFSSFAAAHNTRMTIDG